MTSFSVTGTYINKNFNQQPFVAGVPYVADTLYLKSDLTFESAYYGRGTYEVKYGLFLSEIHLNGEELSFGSYFENKLYHKPRIILVKDLKQYYEKE
jgi:hypothetical protein